MSRGAQKFKQSDITKAVKGVVNAGLSVKRVEVREGKIIVLPGKPEDGPENEWDAVE